MSAALRLALLAAQGPATGPRWAALLAVSGGECVSGGTDIAHPVREAYAYPDDFDRAIAYAAEHEGRTIHGRGMPPGTWGLDRWRPCAPCYHGPGPIDRDGILLTVDVGDGRGEPSGWRWQAYMPRPVPPPAPALLPLRSATVSP